VISFQSHHLQAQEKKEPPLSIQMKRMGTGEKKHIEINATLLKPGSYSALIVLLDQENMSEPETQLRVIKNSGPVLRIYPTDPKKNIGCKLRTAYIAGYEPRKPDTAFVYRLPYTMYRSQPVKATYSRNVNQRFFNQNRSLNWASLHFHLEKGDTVFAVRKGEVVQINDGFDPRDEKGNVSYSSNRNSIRIEQGDGTICNYSVLEKGSFMVSEGDIVYPGTPLGLCGKQNANQEDYQLKLSIHYPVLNPEYDPDSKDSPFLYYYYNPVFATDRGNIKLVPTEEYKAVSSQELIQKEMTKKEIKKKYK